VSTYCNGSLLSYPWSDEAQDNPPNSKTKPKACSSHTAGKGLSMPDLEHEGHNPATKGNLNTYISQQKQSVVVFAAIGLGVRLPVVLSSGIPKCGDGRNHFNHSNANLR
jgi:hypothetical protein